MCFVKEVNAHKFQFRLRQNNFKFGKWICCFLVSIFNVSCLGPHCSSNLIAKRPSAVKRVEYM